MVYKNTKNVIGYLYDDFRLLLLHKNTKLCFLEHCQLKFEKRTGI